MTTCFQSNNKNNIWISLIHLNLNVRLTTTIPLDLFLNIVFSIRLLLSTLTVSNQRRATGERIRTNRSHAVWDNNRGQRGAIPKSVLPNRCDAVWDNNRGQRGTTSKSILPIAVTLSGITTVVNEVQSKSIHTNRCDTVRDSNRGQRRATSKSSCTESWLHCPG